MYPNCAEPSTMRTERERARVKLLLLALKYPQGFRAWDVNARLTCIHTLSVFLVHIYANLFCFFLNFHVFLKSKSYMLTLVTMYNCCISVSMFHTQPMVSYLHPHPLSVSCIPHTHCMHKKELSCFPALPHTVLVLVSKLCMTKL